jgi:hypothetical protein
VVYSAVQHTVFTNTVVGMHAVELKEQRYLEPFTVHQLVLVVVFTVKV